MIRSKNNLLRLAALGVAFLTLPVAVAHAAVIVNKPVVAYSGAPPFGCDPAKNKFVIDAFTNIEVTNINCNGISTASGTGWIPGGDGALIEGDFWAQKRALSTPATVGTFSPALTAPGWYRVYVSGKRTHVAAAGTVFYVYPDEFTATKQQIGYRFVVDQLTQPAPGDGPTYANLGVFKFRAQKAAAAPTTGYVKITNEHPASERVDAVYFEYLGPASVSGLSASDGTYSYKVATAWKAAAGVAYYEIFRSQSNKPPTKPTGTTKGTIFNDRTAMPGVTYNYWVRAKGLGGNFSDLSTPNKGYRAVSAPTDVVASEDQKGKINVTWTPSPGAFSYKVYRATNDSFSDMAEVTSADTDAAATAFSEVPPLTGTSYYYKVRAIGKNGLDAAPSLSAADLGKAL